MLRPEIDSMLIKVEPLSYYVVRPNVLVEVSVGLVNPVIVNRTVVPAAR